jgi:two-component system LytT family response regulator
MKALLVEDEPLARKELRRLLAPSPWIEIVGEATHVDEAEARVRELAPELLFLDIHMPGGTGFDLLARLDYAPKVIFTTAYDQHAVRAFEVNALDYLLKPIEPARLAAALARVRSTEASEPSETPLDRIFVRDGPRCWFVPLAEVSVVSAEGNFVRLHWGALEPLVAKSLVAFEARLDPQRFFRANRAQLVNLDFVDGVDLGIGGRLHVRLRGGGEVEISRRQARLFRARMRA